MTDKAMPTYYDMSNFLASCPSAALAMAIGSELNCMVHEDGFDMAAQLAFDGLEKLRLRLYQRSRDPQGGEIDVLLMLADALGGARGRAASDNPFEDRLRFVEILQGQVEKGMTPNFAQVLQEATR